MGIKIPTNAKLFRSSLMPVFLNIFVFATVLGILPFFIIYSNWWINIPSHLKPYIHFHWDQFYIPILLVLPFALLMSWLLVRFYPIGISSKGIYGTSGVSRRFIFWRDIKAIKPFQYFNLLYLRLYSKKENKVTWVGLFPKDSAGFQKEILRFVPKTKKKLMIEYLNKYLD